jgi:hypothetical protein
LGVGVLLGGCAQVEAQPANPAAPPTTLGKPVGLAINGFNYTDTYIDRFEVNYQGGGNIYVSTPTAGGVKTVCCFAWRPGTKLPVPVEVRWSRDGKRWCEKTLMLADPIPPNPTAIGVHFMPDGNVKAGLSKGYPKLKLRLGRFDQGRRRETGNVIHDEETASCKDGY